MNLKLKTKTKQSIKECRPKGKCHITQLTLEILEVLNSHKNPQWFVFL